MHPLPPPTQKRPNAAPPNLNCAFLELGCPPPFFAGRGRWPTAPNSKETLWYTEAMNVLVVILIVLLILILIGAL